MPYRLYHFSLSLNLYSSLYSLVKAFTSQSFADLDFFITVVKIAFDKLYLISNLYKDEFNSLYIKIVSFLFM